MDKIILSFIISNLSTDMKIRFFILFCFINSLTFAQELKDINWVEDIAYLKKELPNKHIDLFNKKSRKEFNASLDNISREANKLPDLAIAIRLQQVIASFGDSHTNISWTKFIDSTKVIPVQFHWLDDGIYIIQATQENKDLLGGKLLGVNHFPIQNVIDSLKTLITLDNVGTVKKNIPSLLKYLQVLQYFKFCENDSIILNLKSLVPGEPIKKYTLILPAKRPEKSHFIKLKQDTLPVSALNRDKLFHSLYFPAEKIYYIQYNRCWSKELETKYNNGKDADKLPSFAEFEEKVIQDIKNDTIEKLVFDFRYNSGGSSRQGTMFIDNLFRIPKMIRGIPVFAIIGRFTYSSAIINVMDLKKYNNVILVGEETSGKPNHYGEVERFNLPSSGLVVYYSTKYFYRSFEDDRAIKPDAEVLLTITDYMEGNDPSFEYIKAQ